MATVELTADTFEKTVTTSDIVLMSSGSASSVAAGFGRCAA